MYFWMNHSKKRQASTENNIVLAASSPKKYTETRIAGTMAITTPYMILFTGWSLWM
jgi:hypothetical protein